MQSSAFSKSYETTATKQPLSFARAIGQQLAHIGNVLAQIFIPESSIYIRQREIHGQTVWFVRDSLSQRQQYFYSEEALRVWLDKRYYQ